jgi:hypothetical protein
MVIFNFHQVLQGRIIIWFSTRSHLYQSDYSDIGLCLWRLQKVKGKDGW